MTLPDYITAHLGKPFAWGENDCVLFTVGWLEHATGRDYLTAYKPWSSAIEAVRKVDAGGGLEALFDAQLQRIDPRMAVDGDIALVGRTACIFSGPHIVSVGESGLEFLDRMEAKCAWHY
jgi:hypothetical protein